MHQHQHSGRPTAFIASFPRPLLTEDALPLFPSTFRAGRPYRKAILVGSEVAFGLALPTRETGLVGPLVGPRRSVAVAGGRPPDFHDGWSSSSTNNIAETSQNSDPRIWQQGRNRRMREPGNQPRWVPNDLRVEERETQRGGGDRSGDQEGKRK